jgi:hypothetical protein
MVSEKLKYVEISFGIDYILTGETWTKWIFTSTLNFARAYGASWIKTDVKK